jgi:hypothetical protein
MKRLSAILALLTTVFSPLFAQDDSPFMRMEFGGLQRPPVLRPEARSSQIRSIQSLGSFGTAVTSDSIYVTRDAGLTWERSRLTVNASEVIAGAAFENDTNGYAIAVDSNLSSLGFFRTNDGGSKWKRRPIELPELASTDAEASNAAIEPLGGGQLNLEFRIATSSNFEGKIRFASIDGGETWRFVEKVVGPRGSDEAKEIRSGDWTLHTNGKCEGFKVGCYVVTTVDAGGNDLTPPQIEELSLRDKQNAVAEAAKAQMFALPPGGSTRISLNRGFDKCSASSAASMQAWWDNSYFQDANIYMSGRNRACSQTNLTATWVNQVSGMGWGLIPTIVGYQSPCTASTTTAKFSYDVAVAEQQGRGEADIAVTDATNLGLAAGTVLYYDMERYDETVNTPGCRVASVAFLKGWTERLHELGYISGTYGSPANAVPDWWPMPAASRMDAIWMARWDNVMSIWTYNSPSPAFPAGAWEDHQRIKQWQAPHNETWGGVLFNIDGNIADGPVAGLAIAKNRRADFDGDLKSDLSVWRPSDGTWWVINSSNGSYASTVFGTPTDIPVPGDYDGDGRTDRAVFRPSEGTWHLFTKGNTYTTRAFGTIGDIAAPGDFNGDGKTDLAVFRPSAGTWYIANSDSRGSITITQFGSDGDKPVVADFDGDGKDDIGIYRPNGASGGAEWWIQRSSLGLLATQFGGASDKPVAGDYTGDGKADIAFFQPSSGFWFVLRSEDYSYYAVPFGTASDIPTPGDFDGDGKFDTAVFRPADGVWYVDRSTAGSLIVQFGANGDKPVPNAYLPQ